MWYAAVRFWLETFREGNWTFFGVPTAMLVSSLVFLAAGASLVYRHRPGAVFEPWGEPPEPDEESFDDDDEELADDDEADEESFGDDAELFDDHGADGEPDVDDDADLDDAEDAEDPQDGGARPAG